MASKKPQTQQALEYQKYVQKVAPKSPMWLNMIKAFLVGGLICTLGQALIAWAKSMGMDKDGVSAFTAIVLVFLGATLTGIGVYDRIGKFAGAGSIVPITGFANSVVAPAIEFKSEGFVLGVGAKLFTLAGPVLVYGITASVIVGLLKYFFVK